MARDVETHETANLGPGAEPTAPRRDDVVLEVRDLRVAFGAGEKKIEVVRGVSFSIRRGQVVGVVGESGSGKTMTALAIAQLTPHPGVASGDVSFLGRRLSELTRDQVNRLLGKNLGFVFQNPMSALNPALTMGSLLMVRGRVHRGLGRREARAEAIALLNEVHMPSPETQLKRYPHELSGGMQQRGMIAMALMNQPSLLVCDEPTTALDVTIQAQIMDLLAEVNSVRGTAIVLISHNLALTAQNCDRILVMYAGLIVEDLSQDQLIQKPLHPYTIALLRSLPVLDNTADSRFVSVPGDPPDPADLPAGCAFHPRCPLAVERCASESPPLVTQPDGRRIACWVAAGETRA